MTTADLTLAARQEPTVPTRKTKRIDWLGLAITLALGIVVVVPLVVVAIWAFAEVWRYPSILPQEFGLRFWEATLSRPDVWQAMSLSIRLSLTVTLLSAVICLPAAYAFARLDFPGRNLLFLSFLASHAFPKFGLLVAIASIFLNLGLVSTFWGVVLIQLVGTLMMMIWIPVAAFQNVDRAMEEAARDAGAGPLRVFWSVSLPQAAPTIGAAVLLSFVGTFYETEGAWLIGAPEIRTMPVLMITFINNQIVVQYGAVLSVLLWVPSFFALMFSRRLVGSSSFAKGFGV
ncbi:ABC transporter permease [Oceanibium sediminis]|uniref:ABC transporter permease n=1 Tax=Oceanibium sediminis TaxID=2026339 RepID=UPI000DD40277|nr:ABC transporter permease subunit [Oceanibium sediminis]